jgi:20S proteasome alpha/beta subunit
MTVCIAAICQVEGLAEPKVAALVGAADRMLTAGTGDVAYEPEQPKIMGLNQRIVVMISGDVTAHAEVVTRVVAQTAQNNTMAVRDAADLYAKELADHRRRALNRAIFVPLGTTVDYFLQHQNEFAAPVLNSILGDVARFEIDADAIVCGVDNAVGAQVYVITSGGQVVNRTYVGFAAIGIGASHAQSQFMFARYSLQWDFPRALLLAYSAKKRAEAAPGVGRETDMFFSDVTRWWQVAGDPFEEIRRIYDRQLKKAAEATAEGEREVQAYVTELFRKAREVMPPPTAVTSPEGIEGPPRSVDGTASGRL